MAVAVKTSPGARSSGSPASPAILSLIGVLYLLGCLAIVFGLIPWLWWQVWERLAGTTSPFVGGSLLLLVCLAAGFGLLWLGVRLLGPHPPEGVRAGVFVGLVGLLLVVLLTRWVSLWLEYWAYADRSLSPTTGAILTGIAGGVLLAVWLRLFTRPKVQNFVLRLEQGGWFHATTYKGNQGVKVRRGTILGMLLLIGSGVWTLVSHGTLRRGSPDWAIAIPFTGVVQVDSFGDAEDVAAALPATDKKQVQVRWPGRTSITGLQSKAFLSPTEYKDKVNAVLKDDTIHVPADVRERLTTAAEKDDIVKYVLAVDHEIVSGLEELLRSGLMLEDVRRRLQNMDKNTDWADISDLIAAVQKEADKAVADLRQKVERAKQASGAEQVADDPKVKEWEKALAEEEKTRWAFALPTAVVEVDRYALQKANDALRPAERVRVGVNRNPNFKLREGDVVTTEQFDRAEVNLYTALAERVVRGGKEGKEVLAELRSAADGAEFKRKLDELIEVKNPPLKTRLEALRTEVRDQIIPERQTLAQATGTTRFASIPLLPAVQFTVPLLLLVVALWLAWRVVNVPTFADFLIATEAELNKVSWTTQRRLAQDTVVVLITVLLMAVFLFSMDYFWKTVLSWKPIGVLHIPEDSGKQKQKLEEKKW
jgi:preprotein translocase SecE subunit